MRLIFVDEKRAVFIECRDRPHICGKSGKDEGAVATETTKSDRRAFEALAVVQTGLIMIR
jgi:hypothetical protein